MEYAPSGNLNIAIENGPVEIVIFLVSFPIAMAIFQFVVCKRLPEGWKTLNHHFPGVFSTIAQCWESLLKSIIFLNDRIWFWIPSFLA